MRRSINVAGINLFVEKSEPTATGKVEMERQTLRKYRPLRTLEPLFVPPIITIIVQHSEARVSSIGVRIHANLPSLPMTNGFIGEAVGDEREMNRHKQKRKKKS